MTRRLPRGGVVKTSDGIFVSSDGIFFPSDGIFVPSAVMPASIPLTLQNYDIPQDHFPILSHPFPSFPILSDDVNISVLYSDAIMVAQPLHNTGRQNLTGAQSQGPELVPMAINVVTQSLCRKTGAVGQLLSRHCLHKIIRLIRLIRGFFGSLPFLVAHRTHLVGFALPFCLGIGPFAFCCNGALLGGRGLCCALGFLQSDGSGFV